MKAIAIDIRTRTTVTKAGVIYEVVVNEEPAWVRTVLFGHRREHRANGPAFVRAAREQEQAALRMANEVMR
jgi:hypothetical protein